uniref:Guanine nucleotide-binding protein alphasubunit n=1 Tax=Hirondellea gigas TaxID=1518452 RepID=A0A6A7G840_9CRUS
MGCCASIEQKEELSPNSLSVTAKDLPCYKLLFLGAGESGKSTLFKRMQLRYGRGYTDEERVNFLPVIYENTISPMKTLIWQAEHLGVEHNCQIRPENAEFASLIQNLPEDDLFLDQQIAEAVSILWEDPAIKNTFDLRSGFQIQDSADYFFENCMSIADEDYIPSETDILRCRDRTTGILHQTFDFDGSLFDVYDVGGQRAERKKWMNCFKNVKAVLFVVALSEYDQVCFEDDLTNRLEESMGVFSNVCNSNWFRSTPVILLLNKKDLFKEKLEKHPLSECFHEFQGGEEYEAACQFIREKFEDLNTTEGKIYPHFVCATSEEEDVISNVFKSVQEIIRMDSLLI